MLHGSVRALPVAAGALRSSVGEDEPAASIAPDFGAPSFSELAIVSIVSWSLPDCVCSPVPRGRRA